MPTILKKLLQILILLLITSCGSTKSASDRIADEKFELCSEIKYERLIDEYSPTKGKLILKRNIHSLLENYLIQENYLTDISKNGYSELLNKAIRKEIDPKFFAKFKADLEFDPLLLFPLNYQSGCYDYLIIQLKILDKNSWQYKFRDDYWKSEVEGFLMSDNGHINNALNKIPEEKFEMIIYRKLFLDLIYRHLN
ncbi:hypothetical protein [Winogradskyella costae]|uniref:hypothetical protein n=1 Tax=Winogradskyella costae TaxID=2697008 RepID=UPI001C547C54|nr:hypothetical protein [Winogradskyella costae]